MAESALRADSTLSPTLLSNTLSCQGVDSSTTLKSPRTTAVKKMRNTFSVVLILDPIRLPLDSLGPCWPTPGAPGTMNRNQGSTRGPF